MKHLGIALGGKKASGKDETLSSIMRIIPHVVVVRCKAPLVREFEKITKRKYNKGEDDAELMRLSREIIRPTNPLIVAEYLVEQCTLLKKSSPIPMVVIPDMRYIEENLPLHERLNFYCIKIDAPEGIRRDRCIARDGHDKNFLPHDPSETSVDALKYHETLHNVETIFHLHERVGKLLRHVFYEDWMKGYRASV